ncbi:MAG: nuclear transport factor 2 family protein [Prolixibacteraceae bacterium]|nr:nuclear transport factor 2 family protein [Prolixibacteraceae bacterium]
MKIVAFILFIFGGLFLNAQVKVPPKIEKEIQAVFDMQEKAWNEGNLEKFMEGYWKSDQLVFVGSRGPTYGWQETLDSYKKGYPDKKTMGTLKFETLSIFKIDRKTVFLIGKWELTRESGNVSGHFSLIWQKKKGKWVIVADHSS